MNDKPEHKNIPPEDQISIEEENVPEPLFVAISKARLVIFAVIFVFFFLAMLGLLAYGVATLGVLILISVAIIANWPKDIERIAQTRPDQYDKETPDISRLLEAIPDPVIALTDTGNIAFSNDNAENVFGQLTPARHISSVIRAPNVLDAIDIVSQDLEPMRVSFDLRGDIERNFDVYIVSLRDENLPYMSATGPIATLLVLGDLTQQERIENMRADFVANVSHELRTPLASLLGFIETIKGSAKNDAAARDKFLDIMHDQAARMTRLINDLLSLSRIEMNVHQPPSGRVDLKAIIDHVADVLLPVAEQNNVAVNVIMNTSDATIAGERDELIQVFQNLIENAIKYGGRDKEVEISITDEDPDMLSVSVRDHGPGIAPEDLPRLTERFYRVDVLESREKGGTGLGLAIVKHILNRHRAQLSIKSTLGEGSIFSIRFLRQHM